MTIGAEKIATMLAEDVHAGILKPNAMLPSERDLCERFGVGRSVVREAVQRLEAMRLVELRKGHRPRIASPTLTQLLTSISAPSRLFFQGTEGSAHMQQARLFLETSLVRYAAESATPGQIGKMIAAIEMADEGIDDLSSFRAADMAFHRALSEVPGNPIFIALHDVFVGGMRLGPPREVSGNNRRSNDEHKGIVQAIIAHDAETAVAITTKHLTRTYEAHLIEVLTHDEDSQQNAEV